MALINCPECNKQISDKARACPNCGFTLEEKKYTFRDLTYEDIKYLEKNNYDLKKYNYVTYFYGIICGLTALILYFGQVKALYIALMFVAIVVIGFIIGFLISNKKIDWIEKNQDLVRKYLSEKNNK